MFTLYYIPKRMNQLIILFLLCVFTQACRILSLSGGGAHGAFQAGVIKKLHDQGTTWDIITGISVGSFNGIALGLFSPQNQSLGIDIMTNLWSSITANDVYNYNWNPIYDQAILDNTPLNNTIFNLINKYGGIAQRDIIIGAVNLNTGLMRLFDKTQLNSPNRTNNIVMASASIPIIFPPVFFDGNYYVDGGTFSNELIIPGIDYCLKKGDSNITIDMIICSPPITNITNEEIYKDTIIGIATRIYDVVSNVVYNHELYSTCDNKKKINKLQQAQQAQQAYPMYIYKPLEDYAGGILDFNHNDIVSSFKMGYNLKQPSVTKYCIE